jgi:GAF domain-containing protein
MVSASLSLFLSHLKGLKFYNLNSLFGKVMTTQRPVISNDPSSDPRAAGVPEGHPPLNHFLGLPFFHNGKLTGMVGISNKPGGYSEEDIEFLEPLTVTCSNLIHAFQQIERNEYLINTLEESVKARTQELETVNHNLEEANRQVRQNAVMQMQHFACMSHEIRCVLVYLPVLVGHSYSCLPILSQNLTLSVVVVP